MQPKKTNIRNGFSDRNKIRPLNTVMQFESFDEHSRNKISNLMVSMIRKIVCYLGLDKEPLIAEKLLVEIFDETVSFNNTSDLRDVTDEIKDVCLQSDYSEILSLIEKMCQITEEYEDRYNSSRKKLKNSGVIISDEGQIITQLDTWYDVVDDLFETEYIGYRFLNNQICRITSKTEIESIKNAFSTPYDKVNEHISKAISLIKENGIRDYKNSIKECVSALECLLNIKLNTNDLSLGKAIDEYAKKTDIHQAFKKSISQLYGYTSDSPGIRHGVNKKDNKEGFNEAKLILVITSGYINYILSRK